MKNLSRWAAQHLTLARVLIALGHILIGLNTLLFAFITYAYDLQLPPWLIPTFGFLYFVTYFFYPKIGARKGWFRYSYLRQKTCDFVLVMSAFLTISTALNNFAFSPEQTQASRKYKAQLIVLKVKPQEEKASKRELRKTARKKFRKMKKQIKSELRQLKKEMKKRGNKKGAKLIAILLILMTLGIVVLLTYFIAALSCNLSCSGQESLSVMVFVLGLAGIISLTIISLKKIIQFMKDSD